MPHRRPLPIECHTVDCYERRILERSEAQPAEARPGAARLGCCVPAIGAIEPVIRVPLLPSLSQPSSQPLSPLSPSSRCARAPPLYPQLSSPPLVVPVVSTISGSDRKTEREGITTFPTLLSVKRGKPPTPQQSKKNAQTHIDTTAGTQ